MTLRSQRSTTNNRVSLISEAKPDINSSQTYTTLRQSTRSQTRSSRDESPAGSKLNLVGFAYADPSPRKRVKLEPGVKNEPLNSLTVKAEPGRDDDEELVEVKSNGSNGKARAKRESGSATPKSDKRGQPMPARTKPHPEPPRWWEQYQLIERMRAGIDAPVDTMGCAVPLTMPGLDPKTLRFHILISLMLSSQTKDVVTSQAVVNLHEALPGGLTAASLAAAPRDSVAECINKVGFWRRKTDYIQDAARTLLAQEGDASGDVPQTIEELVALKGVGPKMGFLALQAAWDINAGIGVDVHVHRITNRLKWHKPPTKTPEETRVNLESWLPPPFHKPINPLLVGFGQTICLPVGPRCDICLLGQQALCPSRTKVNAAGRKEVVFNFDLDPSGRGAGGLDGPKIEIGYEGGEVEVKEEIKEVKDVQVKEEIKEEITEEITDVDVKVEGLRSENVKSEQ